MHGDPDNRFERRTPLTDARTSLYDYCVDTRTIDHFSDKIRPKISNEGDGINSDYIAIDCKATDRVSAACIATDRIAADCMARDCTSTDYIATDCIATDYTTTDPDWSDVRTIEFKERVAAVADVDFNPYSPCIPSDATSTRSINHVDFLSDLPLVEILEAHRPTIDVEPASEPFSLVKFLTYLFCSTRLSKDLYEERDLVFCLAKHPVDALRDSRSVLRTVYRSLTGSTVDCERYGAHWADIGFQGNDPATDFRGTGSFGLLQLLRLVTDEESRVFARMIYIISQDAERNFPFCVLCINLSKLVLENLRSGRLNCFSNQAASVFEAVHVFYVGLLRSFSIDWRCNGLGVESVGVLLQKLAVKAERNAADAYNHGLDLLRKKETVYLQEENDFSDDL